MAPSRGRQHVLARAVEALGHTLCVFDRESSPEYWAAATFNLATAQLRRQDDPTGDSVEQAIEALEAVSRVRTHEAQPLRWAEVVHQLGVCFLRRFAGDPSDNVERAIHCFDQALEVRTCEAHPEPWAQSTDLRGTAFLRRARGERADNVEEAIRCYEAALSVRTRERMPEAWAATTMNLATAYRNRVREDRAENLEVARRLCLDALEVRTRESDPFGWATVHMNLGIIYGHRVRGDRMANLEEAIRSYELALQVRTAETTPVDWALVSMNLGTAYLTRRQGDPAENLERAVEAFRGTLEVRTRDAMPVDWSISTANLGAALARRRRGDPAENVEEAIRALEEALTVQTREAMPQHWFQTSGNLASAYTRRVRGDRQDNLDKAREIYEEVLDAVDRESLPLEWAQMQSNLGYVHGQQRRGDRGRNVRLAVAAYERALEVFAPDLLPEQARRAARQLGDLCMEEGLWQDAARAYHHALAAVETIYRSSALLESRQAEQALTPDLDPRAAWVFARTGEAEAAVVALERGRARDAREALERDSAGLGALRQERPELFAAFRDAAEKVRDFENVQRSFDADAEAPREPFTVLHRRAEELRSDLARAAEAIRSVPGYEHFLDLPDLADVARAVAEGGPMLYLVTTTAGSLALLARASEDPRRVALELFWHDSLTLDELDGLLVERRGDEVVGGYLVDQFDLARDPTPERRQRFERRLEEVAVRLVDPWLDPLTRELLSRGIDEVALVAGGRLSLLPFHVVDGLGVRYAPSARIAHLARESSRSSPAPRLVAVGHAGGGARLPYLESEVDAVVSAPSVESAVLRGDGATPQHLEAALSEATHLHLACHGGFDVDRPLDSGLDLAGRRWTLRRILELAPRLSSLRLVVLSACQTGLTEWNRLPDELTGLPAGFLQAGVPGVVATLWPADDLSTVLLMEDFYQRLFAPDGPHPATALRQAQRALRELTVRQMRERVGDEASSDDPLAAVIARMLGRVQLYGLDATPFASPYYWAPFYYVGA